MRSVLTTLASIVLAGTALLAGAAPASATARHVGIVVRYANGHVSAGCTTVGGSGLQALERKHTVTMGTQQYSGFVLKIDGVGTARPDNTHYWSYWHSNGRGGWTYSSAGAASYTPKAGTVDGWSYVNGQSAAPKPRSYTYAALCGHLDPKPAPKTTPSTATASTSPTSARPSHSAPARTATPLAPTRSAPASTSRADIAPPPHRHSRTSAAAKSTTPAQPAPSTNRGHASRSAANAPTTTSDPTTSAPSPVAHASDASTSSALPAIGALVVVAALGITAWLVARRRTG